MRRNYKPQTFDFSYPCPHCKAKIEPAQILRVDGERCKCPHCGELYVEEQKAPRVSTS